MASVGVKGLTFVNLLYVDSPVTCQYAVQITRHFSVTAYILCLCVARGVLYSSSVDCLIKTVRSEGFWALYKGFLPIWSRMVNELVLL